MRPQSVPVAFMAGVELSAATIHGVTSADLHQAGREVAARIYNAVIDEEFSHTGVWENGRELSFEELAAEGFWA